jgi:hypothetical protein
MYSRVGGVQKRMQQTKIAAVFAGLIVPPRRTISALAR